MTKSGTILVVDDDAELRRGLSTLLGSRGYRILEADNGLEASEMIDVHQPDLVILDMMMPRWGGLAVLERFRGQSNAPPFIMITANEGIRHRDYAEQLGVADYIRKPFSTDRLLQRIDRLVPAPAAAAPSRPAAPKPAATLICRCPRCGSRIKAPVKLLGQTRACPGCKREFIVTYQPPEDMGPILMMDDRCVAVPHGPR